MSVGNATQAVNFDRRDLTLEILHLKEWTPSSPIN